MPTMEHILEIPRISTPALIRVSMAGAVSLAVGYKARYSRLPSEVLRPLILNISFTVIRIPSKGRDGDGHAPRREGTAMPRAWWWLPLAVRGTNLGRQA